MATFRCNGRCSRAFARLIEDFVRLIHPWWLAMIVMIVAVFGCIALAAYISVLMEGRQRWPRRRKARKIRNWKEDQS